MFRRKKKIEQDYSYYDDYYDDYDYEDEYDYEDDYDYDDAYEDDDYEDEEETASEKISTKEEPILDKSLEKELRSELEEKQQIILTLKQEKADLDLQFASLQALPKHYQQLEEEQGNMSELVLALEKEKNELLERLNTSVAELDVKQVEIDSLAGKLLNSSDVSTEELESVNFDLMKELEVTKKELAETKRQLHEAEQSAPEFSKEDIAAVMLEAQAKARKIIERANYDSKRIVIEAEKDLSAIGQEARNHFEKIKIAKEESEVVFNDFLARVGSIVELDKNREG